MPIDKLQGAAVLEPSQQIIVDKINEMIEQLNRLETHFHESLDTHYYTTLPRYSDTDDRGDDE
jgi:hypothetical protein